MSPPDADPPRFMGPYRVEAKIGQGGMGAVYRAVHEKTGQRVAIKVLSGRLSEQSRFRRRFSAEVEALKKLHHPNIVRLIGYGEHEGELFYAMELVEGPSLLEHLRKVKRLDWDATIGLSIEICGALKHAHDLGVIHRDLKPANLLLEPEGGVKLTDFGIAKLFGASEQTAAGSVLGTADYMAPEQAAGTQVSSRTDLYSLGSLMYACLAGRPPFSGRSLTEVLVAVKQENPVPLDLILPDVPPELAELIHELLEKEPQNRPPTALVVGKRLAAMRAGLRRRAEQTRIDAASGTFSDLEPAIEPIVHRKLLRPTAEPRDTAITAEIPQSQNKDHVPTLAASPKTADDGADPSLDIEIDDHYPLAPNTPRTRFETVADSSRSAAGPDATTGPLESSNWLSIGVWTTSIVLLLASIVWMLQPPSDESLLQKIAQLESAGDELQSKQTKEEFLRLYPQHAQAAEVRDSIDHDQIDQRLRQLLQRLRRQRSEDPARIAWVSAMEQERENRARSKAMLRAWLAVYDHPAAFQEGLGDDQVQELVALSKQWLADTEKDAASGPDPRAQTLDQWIQWGLNRLSGPEREQFKASLLQLYADEPWAQTSLLPLKPESN